MNKKIRLTNKILASILFFTVGCSNTDTSNNSNNSPNSAKQVNTNNDVETSTREKVQNYINENDIFSQIPYSTPDKYETDLSGDGVPIFLTGDGVPIFLTGDGVPIFGIKNENSDNTYLWNRKPKDLIFDYLQVTNTNEEIWGHATYARYSQIINYDISITSPIEKSKNAELVKTIGFSLVEKDNNLKVYSVSPISIRPKHVVNPYIIRRIMFTTEKDKYIQSDIGLIPLPGISLEKSVKTNKIKLFADVIFKDDFKPNAKDFSVIASIKGKQFNLYHVSGNLYGNEVEIPELEEGKTEGLVIEAIDRKSLTDDETYIGFTYIIPLTK